MGIAAETRPTAGLTLDAFSPAAGLPRAANRPSHAPNAALLIDFDNVTLGIRSDLTKELSTLLNSDIIKGKVAVQRAYADWRRYPQYIVPLSESSIDLIFAPAFGSNKKNATDIRLAIDAIELVFTRPEIGTFILLSGDSDFSMLVIKLKEYGKYVIGVGIRESASDLLIQNCDEYYSYNDLAGLTKEADTPSAQRDPWELVTEAVAQMARNGDVMRSDRLKQVMQQIDPNFDEKNAGFNRFSKFVLEAGHKGLIKLTKLENGQYEVAPAGGCPPVEAAAGRAGARRRARPGRARTGRGGRARGSRAAGPGSRPGPRPGRCARSRGADAWQGRGSTDRRTLGDAEAPDARAGLRADAPGAGRAGKPGGHETAAPPDGGAPWQGGPACSRPAASPGCCARPTTPRSPTCARSATTSTKSSARGIGAGAGASPARSADAGLEPDGGTAVPGCRWRSRRPARRYAVPSRGPAPVASASVIPLVGVVQLDDEEPEAVRRSRRSCRARSRRRPRPTARGRPRAPPRRRRRRAGPARRSRDE